MYRHNQHSAAMPGAHARPYVIACITLIISYLWAWLPADGPASKVVFSSQVMIRESGPRRVAAYLGNQPCPLSRWQQSEAGARRVRNFLLTSRPYVPLSDSPRKPRWKPARKSNRESHCNRPSRSPRQRFYLSPCNSTSRSLWNSVRKSPPETLSISRSDSRPKSRPEQQSEPPREPFPERFPG
jgi:hypothetical protein